MGWGQRTQPRHLNYPYPLHLLPVSFTFSPLLSRGSVMPSCCLSLLSAFQSYILSFPVARRIVRYLHLMEILGAGKLNPLPPA